MRNSPQTVELAAIPVPPSDRLASIDVLRGLALFGVMAINVVFEFRVSIFERFLPGLGPNSALDRTVETVLIGAIDSKSLALFSLLFGVGLAIQFDRLAGNKLRVVLLARRLTVLLVIGLIHLFLIWNGDILTEYALAGVVALPFLLAPRWFLAMAGVLFLGIYLALPPVVPFPDHAWMAEHVLDARRVYATGTFLEVLMFRVSEVGAILPLHVAIFPRTLALFLIGAFIWRTGVLGRALENRHLLFGIAFVGLSIGAALTIEAAGSALTPVILALGYGATVIAIMSTAIGQKLLSWAAPLGRMAFTNYITQSVIFTWVFYGYGFGLFGELGVAAALIIGVAVYAAQAFLSRHWLNTHKFGPIEWLWRRLMYGSLRSLHLSKAAA